MEKETKRTPQEIAEEFLKRHKPPKIVRFKKTNPVIEAFFAQKLEEAKKLMANARRAPQQEND